MLRADSRRRREGVDGLPLNSLDLACGEAPAGVVVSMSGGRLPLLWPLIRFRADTHRRFRKQQSPLIACSGAAQLQETKDNLIDRQLLSRWANALSMNRGGDRLTLRRH